MKFIFQQYVAFQDLTAGPISQKGGSSWAYFPAFLQFQFYIYLPIHWPKSLNLNSKWVVLHGCPYFHLGPEDFGTLGFWLINFNTTTNKLPYVIHAFFGPLGSPECHFVLFVSVCSNFLSLKGLSSNWWNTNRRGQDYKLVFIEKILYFVGTWLNSLAIVHIFLTTLKWIN